MIIDEGINLVTVAKITQLDRIVPTMVNHGSSSDLEADTYSTLVLWCSSEILSPMSTQMSSMASQHC
jgi:hypothetical protein